MDHVGKNENYKEHQIGFSTTSDPLHKEVHQDS